MPSEQTSHIVSEHLADRYPYNKSTIRSNKTSNNNILSYAFGQRGITKLVESIESSSEEQNNLKLNACNKILPLLSSQENKSQAIDCNLVEICTKLLLDRKNKDIVIAAANMLTSLFTDLRARKDSTILFSAVTNLVSCIGKSRLRGKTAALQTLECISSFRDAREVLDSNVELLQTVITTLLKNCALNSKTVLLTLSSITKSKIGCSIAVKNDIVTKLQQYFSTTSSDTRKSVISCFNNIAIHRDQGVKEAIEDANIISFLITELSNNNETLDVTTSALMAFSTFKDAKLQLSERAANDVASLFLSILLSSCESEKLIKSNVVTIIQNACENIPKDTKTYTRMMIEAGHPELVLSVFHSKACGALQQLLKEENRIMQVLDILWQLSGSESGIVSMTNDCLNFIDELVEKCGDDEKKNSTSSLAKNILQNIAASSDANARRVSKSLEKH